MSLMHAQTASVAWDTHKKRWTLVITAGAEVIRRAPESPLTSDAPEDALRRLAVDTAKDEGYELAAEHVSISRISPSAALG